MLFLINTPFSSIHSIKVEVFGTNFSPNTSFFVDQHFLICRRIGIHIIIVIYVLSISLNRVTLLVAQWQSYTEVVISSPRMYIFGIFIFFLKNVLVRCRARFLSVKISLKLPPRQQIESSSSK